MLGKFLNESLNSYFLATRVELMSFSIRSVSLYDKRGITATLLSMKKSQVTDAHVSNPSCLS